MDIEFIVPGAAMGKQRPRFVRRGKFVSTYTPQETKNYQKQVLISYNKVARGKKLFGSIKADVCAIYEPPKSVSKKTKEKMLNGEIPYTKKPDVDNILKSVCDALNEVSYDDDAQIDKATISKVYGEKAMCQVRLSDSKHAVKPFIKIKKDKKNNE
jgi:Holliday junction resolvase RusA-like endonuclease